MWGVSEAWGTVVGCGKGPVHRVSSHGDCWPSRGRNVWSKVFTWCTVHVCVCVCVFNFQILFRDNSLNMKTCKCYHFV